MPDYKTDELSPQELVELTTPHANQLNTLGALRDDEAINDKALEKAQHPVLYDLNLAVVLRLRREQYRRLWAYQDRYQLDKWQHKDKIKEMKRQRRAEVKAAKEKRRAERKAAGKGTPPGVTAPAPDPATPITAAKVTPPKK